MQKNRIVRILSLLLAAIWTAPASVLHITAFPEPSFAAIRFETGIYAVEDDMNFRAAPSMEAKVLGVIPKGYVVLIDRVDGIWGHTTYEGAEGWLSLEFSSAPGATQNTFSVGLYRTDVSLNFRSTAAELKNNIIGLVPGETVLSVTEISGSWGKVRYDGKSGWISLNYCTPCAPEEETTSRTPEPVAATPSDVSAEAAVDWLVIDISRHNAVEYFDWPAVKKSGVEGVIIRVGGRGYGLQHDLYDDVAFYQHYTGAKAAGLHIGAYFFSYALNEEQAEEEAQMTINILRSCRADLDMPVYIDIEDYAESDYTDDQHVRAGKAVCTKVVDTFCNTIQKAGYYPGVYCNKFFAQTLLDQSVFTGRALWIAHYAAECGYKDTPVGMWQYSSTGHVDGYAGKNLDVNRCYVNYPAVISGRISVQTPVATPADGREWITTKGSACTEQKTENIFSNGVLYEQHTGCSGHSAAVGYVMTGDVGALHAGRLISFADVPDNCRSENDARYQSTLDQAIQNGGCRFKCCGSCGEILTAEFYAPSDCRHSFTETIISGATCTAEGRQKTVCERCGFVRQESVITQTEHTPGDMYYREEENGGRPYYARFCCVCQQRLFASYDFIPGDVNGDFKTDAADARLTLRCATNLETISYIYLKNADFDRDDQITPADARLILRRSVNLE